MTDAEKVQIQETEKFVTAFEEAMEDDFNTADAIAAIFELVKFANTTADETSSQAYDSALLERIVHLSDVLGIIVVKEEELLAEDIEALIEERQAARKTKNFQRADEIRNELLEKGIILEDTREGVNGKEHRTRSVFLYAGDIFLKRSRYPGILSTDTGIYWGQYL